LSIRYEVIWWVDSEASPHWQGTGKPGTRPGVDYEDQRIISVGLVYEETDTVLELVSSIPDEDEPIERYAPMCIPKRAILKRKLLGRYKLGRPWKEAKKL
jgi:hypothetical protein